MTRADISDDEKLATALEGVDAVVHLAAIVGHPACQREPGHAWTTNVDGIRSLLRLRASDQRLLFASTGSVYGKVRDEICTEGTPVHPLTLYAKSKAEGERLALATGNVIVFRFATGFGVSQRMRFDLLVNDLVHQAIHRGNLVVYQRESRRSLIHVRDMARSIAFALKNWDAMVDNVYNVGSEAMNLSKAEIVQHILNQISCHLHFAEFASDPDQRDYAVSYERIQRKGLSLSVGLDEGIAQLVQAARLAV
jgi:nucleoside-diphosphate-sugar epimerase